MGLSVCHDYAGDTLYSLDVCIFDNEATLACNLFCCNLRNLRFIVHKHRQGTTYMQLQGRAAAAQDCRLPARLLHLGFDNQEIMCSLAI